MRAARGFTLVELLAALAILALIGSLGWRGLDAVLGAQAAVQAESRRWEDVDRAMRQLGRDLSLEQPVAYRLRGNLLERNTPAAAGILLEDVSSFNLHRTPRSLTAEIVLAGGERVWRIFPLP